MADANFEVVILSAVKRREPDFDFQTEHEAGLADFEDREVLASASHSERVSLTHDVRTMAQLFASFIEEQNGATPGLKARERQGETI
ncbi:DUF5615 family PIN-like protein [Candidatus Entotheonella palauensis]|uniref:DUF5615 family PIN-like protein n=1 Tax=Candidatus Entotheonella palauensis TaxID=93172 RepID=UPI0004B06C48|nr:DUF5615 family PIN-like protein [Candidatus Entotheonella palauensis]